MSKHVEKVSVSENISVSEAILIRSRAHLSIQFVQSAALFSRLAAESEGKYAGVLDEALYADYKAYVTGAVFNAVFFLEATINEFFMDAIDNRFNPLIKALPDTVVDALAQEWLVNNIGRKEALDKFQIALKLNGSLRFQKASMLYRNADDLVELRNALVHYKPAWVTTLDTTGGRKPPKTSPPKGSPEYIWDRLGNPPRFPLSPLFGVNNSFFPDRCLSHGCAEWAVASSLAFADEFYTRIAPKVAKPYDHVRHRLTTR